VLAPNSHTTRPPIGLKFKDGPNDCYRAWNGRRWVELTTAVPVICEINWHGLTLEIVDIAPECEKC
jgi:hypothetical protein